MSNLTLTDEAKKRVQNIKAILLDVDGVMTDGSIMFDSNGLELKVFNAVDGLGIYLARTAGYKTGIITGRSSRVVELRAKELNVDFLSMGKKNKLNPYNEFKEKFGLKDEEVAFMGDDLLDLSIQKLCGFALVPVNGTDEVKANADYITEKSGGNGAVREAIEVIFKGQGKWESFLESYFKKLTVTDR